MGGIQPDRYLPQTKQTKLQAYTQDTSLHTPAENDLEDYRLRHQVATGERRERLQTAIDLTIKMASGLAGQTDMDEANFTQTLSRARAIATKAATDEDSSFSGLITKARQLKAQGVQINPFAYTTALIEAQSKIASVTKDSKEFYWNEYATSLSQFLHLTPAEILRYFHQGKEGILALKNLINSIEAYPGSNIAKFDATKAIYLQILSDYSDEGGQIATADTMLAAVAKSAMLMAPENQELQKVGNQCIGDAKEFLLEFGYLEEARSLDRQLDMITKSFSAKADAPMERQLYAIYHDLSETITRIKESHAAAVKLQVQIAATQEKQQAILTSLEEGNQTVHEKRKLELRDIEVSLAAMQAELTLAKQEIASTSNTLLLQASTANNYVYLIQREGISSLGTHSVKIFNQLAEMCSSQVPDPLVYTTAAA